MLFNEVIYEVSLPPDTSSSVVLIGYHLILGSIDYANLRVAAWFNLPRLFALQIMWFNASAIYVLSMKSSVKFHWIVYFNKA